MIGLSDFACGVDCAYAGKPWPKHLPKPTCRIIAELPSITNPVTISVYRDILRNRMNGNPPKECVPPTKANPDD